MKITIWDGREFDFDGLESKESLKTMDIDALRGLRKDVVDERDGYDDMDAYGLVLDEVESMIDNELLSRARAQ